MHVGTKGVKMQNKNNLACRIFKEQIDLIQQLPENERAEVLYKAILSSLNQIENQNDNQIENQNENAYVSVSVSESVSVLGKTVFSLLQKNIVFKEFSNNYGGRRIGAGRKQTEPELTPAQKKEKITFACKKIGRIVGKNQILVTKDFTLPENDYFNAYKKELPKETESVVCWIRKNKMDAILDYQWIGKQIQNFHKRKTGRVL